MTLGGWLILVVSVGIMTTLFVWTIVKVLTLPDIEGGPVLPDEPRTPRKSALPDDD